MRSLALAFVVVAVAACDKSEDLAPHQAEATAVAKFYQPQLDALQKRLDGLLEKSRGLTASTPGVGDAGRRFADARDRLAKLRALAAHGGDGLSALEHDAQAAGSGGNVDEVERVVHTGREQIVEGIGIVNDDLAAVEAWFGQRELGDRATAPTPGAAVAKTPDPLAPEPR